MSIGYSGTPLFKKLGIKPGSIVFVQNAPDNYLELLSGLPESASFSEAIDQKVNVIHLFTNSFPELAEMLLHYQTSMNADAAIWISWYKKAAKIPTELTEDVIRETALKLTFVDVKVCAVDEKWSGLKLVNRKENR